MIKRKIFGLDISDHSIEALLLIKPFFGKPKIVSYARMVLSGEVVKDGVIRNPAELADSISKLLQSAKPQAIKTPYCILSLPESQVFTTIFKLPAGLRPNEVKNTVPYKAEEVIPFKPAEFYFDFKSITKHDITQEVFYVAVPIKIVDSYSEVLKSIGLKPIAFDLESVSLARALFGLAKKSDQAKLLVDIGARTTNLDIFDHNGIRQSLALKTAGNRFTKAIAKSLRIKEKEASELKMKNGFNPKAEKGRIFPILQKEFQLVIEEAKKLIEYYQIQTQRRIDEVILVGGTALSPKIDQYLADKLGIETNLGNPLIKVNDPENIVYPRNKAVLFTNVIGLALRGLAKNPAAGDINLLPLAVKRFALMPKKEEKKAWLFIYIWLAILAFLILVSAGLFFLRQQGFDLYQKVFSPLLPEAGIISEVNPEVLDELREHFLIPTATPAIVPTTTPTATPAITEEITAPVIKLKIKQTSLGYLNVREGPGTGSLKVGQVYPGDEYDLIGQEGDWYKIEFTSGSFGWVYSIYVDRLE